MITADSTLWTADTHCVTADGRVVCLDADVLETATALDALDAVKDVAAVVVEAATAVDETDAAIGAQVLFGTVAEAAAAADVLDADVVAAEVPVSGGGYYPRPSRPFPVVGYGFGILPELGGEARGVVGVVGVGAGTLQQPVDRRTPVTIAALSNWVCTSRSWMG